MTSIRVADFIAQTGVFTLIQKATSEPCLSDDP